MPFYTVKDEDFFEFIASYSYTIDQQNAFEMIKQIYDNGNSLFFMPQNTDEDKAKLNFELNSVPPKIDLKELANNVTYPYEALNHGYESRIIITAEIDVDGSILFYYTKFDGPEIFIEAGVNALKKTTIIPGTAYGEPFPSIIAVPINFILR
jgi:hypothetical protein